MRALGPQAPYRDVAGFLRTGVRVALLRVDEVGELDGVLDEEHRGVCLRRGRSCPPRCRTSARSRGGHGPRPRSRGCLPPSRTAEGSARLPTSERNVARGTGDIRGDREGAVGGGATGVHDTLRTRSRLKWASLREAAGPPRTSTGPPTPAVSLFWLSATGAPASVVSGPCVTCASRHPGLVLPGPTHIQYRTDPTLRQNPNQALIQIHTYSGSGHLAVRLACMSDLLEPLRGRGWRIIGAAACRGRGPRRRSRPPDGRRGACPGRRRAAEISRATVYNTLGELVSLGEVLEVATDKRAKRYDPNAHRPHDHLVCAQCGSIRDVHPSEQLARRPPHSERFGFTVSDVEVTYRGLCPTCASA